MIYFMYIISPHKRSLSREHNYELLPNASGFVINSARASHWHGEVTGLNCDNHSGSFYKTYYVELRKILCSFNLAAKNTWSNRKLKSQSKLSISEQMNLFESSFLLFLVWTFLAKPKQKFKFDIWGSLIYEQTAIIKKINRTKSWISQKLKKCNVYLPILRARHV